ncbi:MAG: SCO family protein [Planctomycetota bacterium]
MQIRPIVSTLRRGLAAALCVLAFGGLSGVATGQILLSERPEEIQNLDVTERLGERLPRGLTFTDHKGERVALDDVIARGKPIIFAFVYFDCPIVCTVVLDRTHKGLRQLDYTIGEDFTLLVISFDHTEGASEAESRRILDVTGYDRSSEPGVSDGFVYLTGAAGDLRALSEATGFPFRRLSNGEYSHPVGIMVLSPEGRLSRYLYGFEYPPKELKLSLLDASDGKVAKSLGDALLHFCYRYDPTAGAYNVEAMAVMRIAGALTVVLLAGFLIFMFASERFRRRTSAEPDAANTTAPAGLARGTHA